MTVRTVAVALRMEISSYVAGARGAASATRALADELQRSRHATDSIARGLTAAGAIMAGGFLLSIRESMRFEKAMSEVGAVVNTTSSNMERLRTAALDAGKATQYSATEAAKAEAELAKAGLSAADILNGGLNGALALAAAGGLDLAEAADVAAKAMSQFGLAGQSVGHIADMLAGGANATATDVHGLSMALKMGGGAAHAMGMSLDDTVITLGAFTKGALVGSDAGTSMKTMMMMLASPTEKASNLMRELGFSAFDAKGQFVGVYELANRLQVSLGNLSVQQRMAALSTIFGADAMRAANVLFEQGATGMHQLADQINGQADAAGVAAKKTDNLVGDVERLKGSLQTLAIESGSGANSGMRVLVQAVDGAIGAFSDLPGPVQSSTVVVAGVGGAALLATAGILKMRAMTQETITALTAMGPAGARAATGLSAAASWAGKLGLVGLAVGGMWLGLNALSNWAEKRTGPAKANIEDLTESLQQFADTGKVAGELASKYGDSLQKLGGDVRGVRDGMAALNDAAKEADTSGLFDTGANNLVDEDSVQRLKDLDAALSNLVKNGGATQANLVLQQLRDQGHLTADEFATLVEMLPQYRAAADSAALANSALAKGFGDATTNAATLRTGLLGAVQAGQSLMDVFKQLNGSALSVSDAEIKAENSVRALKNALEESKGSLDITTEAGGEAQGSLNDLARAGAEAAQAVYDQSQSTEAAAAEFERYRQKLINVLVASGKTKAEAKALADQYMNMPSLVTTRLELYGADDAETQIKAIKQALDRIPGTKTINITAKSQLPSGLAMGALMRADGGIVDFYANGGIRDASHVAQIVPAGTIRVFGEPETGGEAYIPFAASKRARSVQVLAQANRMMGYPLGVQIAAARPAAAAASSAAPAAAGPTVGTAVASARAIRAALEGMAVVMDSQVVGRLQGRQADLLRRGG